MAQMLIVLRRDPNTGKQNIIVKLESDPDALPIEHEQMHKTLMEKLLGTGLDAEDLGEIIIEREGSGSVSTTEEPIEPQKQATPQGR